MSQINVLDLCYRIEGRDSHGDFSLELNKKVHPIADNKFQLRIETEDDESFANLSMDGLKGLREMIDRVISENE